MRAIEINRPLQARPHALAGQLDDPELAHPQNFGLGAIFLKIGVQASFQIAAMPLVAKIDEVANNHPAQITQAQLPGNFIRCLDIGLERGGFGVGVLAEFPAVHVDRDDRLRAVDHQRSPRRQRHVPRIHQLNFPFNPKLVKKRRRLLVKLDLVPRADLRA